ncbi:MAG: Na+/H+ antiporter NhaC family protein [Pseudomonadota bacterium]
MHTDETGARSGALAVGLCIAFGIAIWLIAPASNGEHFGGWSLLPAAVTIAICFITRNVVIALLAGVLTGGLVAHELNVINTFLLPSLASEQFASQLLIYVWALGALLGLWNRNGGAVHFARTIASRLVNSRRSAKLFTWGLGILFHQGGLISTVIAGSTARPVADEQGVAHEELSYIVDSTASPIATLIPFNGWPLYVSGLILLPSMAEPIPDMAAALALFFKAIPYNFYAWIAVGMTLLFAFDKLPLFGTPMRKAVDRVTSTGELDRPGSMPMVSKELVSQPVHPDYPTTMLDFIAPILVLLGFCIVPWVLGGEPWIFEAFGLAVLTSFGMTIWKGMPINVVIEAALDGVKGVTVAALILGLALSLATVAQHLGTSVYVVNATTPLLNQAPYVLPSLLLLVCMITSFSIGSSWGTYAVIFPIALPLAWAINPDESFLLLTFGSVMGGALYGDQCSPVSDTTILSSLACGADLMDHVVTQLWLASMAAGLAAVLYLVAALVI